MIFLKVVKEVLKTHKAGIIHDDLKLGNVLVNVVGEAGYKFTEVQLIDWNLASFYFPGYDSNLRKGTACFYPPELLLRTTHITPAADIWSLAIVMFTFFTDRKPFPLKCKTDGLKAIASLIGSRTIIELMDKYRLASFEYVSFVN